MLSALHDSLTTQRTVQNDGESAQNVELHSNPSIPVKFEGCIPLTPHPTPRAVWPLGTGERNLLSRSTSRLIKFEAELDEYATVP